MTKRRKEIDFLKDKLEDLVKDKVNEVLEKVKSDGNFLKKFKENPITAIEEVMGIDLPDDKIEEIIKTVKEKIDK